MAIRFKFRKQRIVTDATFFMFHEFVSIWKWDKAKNKDKAHSMLYFIYLLCDLSEGNPIKDEPLEAKEEKAMKYSYGSKKTFFTKKELELLEPAIECYNKYNNTAEERILTTFDNKAVELRNELEATVPETVEYDDFNGTKFATNSDIITKGLQELNIIKRSKVGVIAAIKKEALTNKIRGQITLSPLSKGALELPTIAVAVDTSNLDVQDIQGETDD